jgi:hypothetical protein
MFQILVEEFRILVDEYLEPSSSGVFIRLNQQCNTETPVSRLPQAAMMQGGKRAGAASSVINAGRSRGLLDSADG